MAWERVGRELFGVGWRARAVSLALAVGLAWLAGASVLGVPYPPINRITVWAVIGGLAAAVSGYLRGGLVASCLIAILPMLAADGAGPVAALVGLVLGLLMGWGFLTLHLPSAIVLGLLGHALGEAIRRRRGESTTWVGDHLLGEWVPRPVLLAAVELGLLGLVVWLGTRGSAAVGTPEAVALWLVTLALPAVIGLARGGLALALLAVIVPAEVYVGLVTGASGVRFSVVVGNALAVVEGVALVSGVAWGVGWVGRRAWTAGRAARSRDGPSVRARLAAARADVGGTPALRVALLAGAIVLLFAVPWTPVLEPTPPGDVEDTAFVLERGVCNGTCPIYEIKVCGNGTVHYIGREYTRITGYRQLTVDEERVRDLVDTTYESDFFRLRGGYSVPVTDLPSTRVRVRLGGRSHTVREYGASGPARLHRLQADIDAVVGNLSDHDAANRLDEPAPPMPNC